jgi:iron-sulfur cluster assembly protein
VLAEDAIKAAIEDYKKKRTARGAASGSPGSRAHPALLPWNRASNRAQSPRGNPWRKIMMSATATSPTAAAAPAAPSSSQGPSKREIEITAAAASEIAKQRDKRGSPDAMIRIGVRGGGCTGFTYVFEWSEQTRPTDKVFSAHGVSIVVDPKSLVYLGGMQLDFVRGMMGHGFKFNNPNAKGSCGCGESVQF